MIWNSDLNRSKAMVPSIYLTLTSIGQVKSLRALGASFQKNRNSKLTPKHPFPGKIAAKELLKENDRIFKKKVKLQENKYAEFNYVTPLENKKISRYQRDDVFVDIESAYSEADMELTMIDKEELNNLRRGS